jgi:hypothetical protein
MAVPWLLVERRPAPAAQCGRRRARRCLPERQPRSEPCPARPGQPGADTIARPYPPHAGAAEGDRRRRSIHDGRPAPPPPRAEGVLYAEKDFNLAEHPEIKEVPNLQVIKLMQSFKSREYVTERFAWRHYYW